MPDWLICILCILLGAFLGAALIEYIMIKILDETMK